MQNSIALGLLIAIFASCGSKKQDQDPNLRDGAFTSDSVIHDPAQIPRDSSLSKDGKSSSSPDSSFDCGDDRILCGTRCINPSTDPANCGSCGKKCDQDQICVNKNCQTPPKTCPPGGCPYGSYCDLNQNRCVPGCLKDEGCDKGYICEDRKCIVGCRTDVACTQMQTCSNKKCVSCPSSYGNCQKSTQDGCETDLFSSHAHCSSCNKPCANDRECVKGNCECAKPTIECGGVCVNPNADPHHCGKCNKTCSDPANGKGVCVQGSCEPGCDNGFHACGKTCASDYSVATCGSLCTPCPTPDHGSALCDGTSCGFACDEGYVQCDNACCLHCKTKGCTGLKWCNQSTGLCEEGCEHHKQCPSGKFCYLKNHECAQTVCTYSCPSNNYKYHGSCSNGVPFYTHPGLPGGTKYIFVKPCPAGTEERGTWYCSDVTRVCVPEL